ncbi:MAG: hypothetical protein MUC43_10125 [Pirellula sp.]|nr:hypothetical protein [Pirellula sp.]
MGQITIEPPAKATQREPHKLTTVFTLCSPASARNDLIAIASTNHLKSCSHSELRKLCCKIERGRLIISGQVSSYYWKQLAQETIRPLSQSLCIENLLDVRSAVSNNSQHNPSEYS